MIQFIQNSITPVTAIVVLLSNIAFVVFGIFLAFHPAFRNRVYTFVYTHIMQIIFAISGVALLGSLAYSNIVGFPPCELCWIQRIFIYPQVLLAFIAMLRKEKIVVYLLPMSVIGAVVALYHSYIQWGGGISIAPCVAVGGECSKVFVSEFGYITIPFMSLAVFAYLIAVSVIYSRAAKKIGK